MSLSRDRIGRQAGAWRREPQGNKMPAGGIRGLIARRREEARRVRNRRIAVFASIGGVVVAGLVIWLLSRSGGTGGGAQEPKDAKDVASPSRDVIVVPTPTSYAHAEVSHQVARLHSPDLRWRVEAAHALAAMGPRAYEAVPALLNAMARKSCEIEFSQAVGRALKAIGVQALPSLASALKSPVAQARFHAASALAKLGPAAAPAVNLLVDVLERDPDYSVRSNAATALGAIGPAASSALPALRRAAGNPNEKITGDPARSELRVRARMAMVQVRGGAGD